MRNKMLLFRNNIYIRNNRFFDYSSLRSAFAPGLISLPTRMHFLLPSSYYLKFAWTALLVMSIFFPTSRDMSLNVAVPFAFRRRSIDTATA